MVYGLIADIHGNLPALEEALAFCAAHGAERYLCAGDLVGYGPFPDECVERVAALPGACVAGNHDLAALGAHELPAGSSPVGHATMRWTRERLGAAARERLAALPLCAEAGDVVLAHGSLDDVDAYVWTVPLAAAELDAARRRLARAPLLVLGHIHATLAVLEGGEPLVDGGTGTVSLPSGRGALLNPGAVGQSRERRPRAQVALLDLEQRRASFHALEYDVGAVRAALRRHGLPERAYHDPPPRSWRRAARSIRRRLRRP